MLLRIRLCLGCSFSCRPINCVCVCVKRSFLSSFIGQYVGAKCRLTATRTFSRDGAAKLWNFCFHRNRKKKSFANRRYESAGISSPRTFLGLVFQRYIFIVLAGSKQLTLSASIRHMVARDKGIAFYFPADVTADRMPRHVYEYKGSFNCASIITHAHRKIRTTYK